MSTRLRLSAASTALLGVCLATTPVLAAETKPPAEKIGERVSRGVIDESLEALDEPRNRQRLAHILSSPEMRDAMHDLAVSIVMGLVDGVRAAKITGEGDAGPAIRKKVDKYVTPAVGRIVHRIVDSALAAALDDEHLAKYERLGEGTSEALLRGVARAIEHDVGPALAATIERDLGPAVAATLARDILPAVGRGLDSPEMTSAIANLSRSIVTELVGGAGDAMVVETEKDEAAGRESGLHLFGDKVAMGYGIAVFVSLALGTMLVALTVMLVRAGRRQREQVDAAQRRESLLLRLIDTLESDHPEIRRDVRRILQDRRHEHAEP